MTEKHKEIKGRLMEQFLSRDGKIMESTYNTLDSLFIVPWQLDYFI